MRGDLYDYLDLIDTTKTCKTPRPYLADRPLTSAGFLANRREIFGSLSLSTVTGSTSTPDTEPEIPMHLPAVDLTHLSPTGSLPIVQIRKSPSVYSQVQPFKKKALPIKKVVDADKIRRKCVRDFQKNWNSAEVIGGYAERNKRIQLMDDEPLRFWSKDIEHEDYNERYKHFELYDKIREESKINSRR